MRTVTTYRGTEYTSANFIRLLRARLANGPVYANFADGARLRVYGVRMDEEGGVALEYADERGPYIDQTLDNGRDPIAF